MSDQLIIKKHFYRTAKATISCAMFSANEFVSVRYSFTDENGTDWFDIDRSERGPLKFNVCYPKHHLTDFCM